MTEYVRLGDVFELQMGKTPSRDILEYWNNGDNPWVSISDMSNYSKYVGKTKETISNLGVEKSGIKIVPPNTVIMSFKLSIGKTAITTDSIYTNEAIMAFIPRDRLVYDADYLYYMLSGLNWDKGVNKAVKGNTLNKKTISNYYVHLPPLEEQKRIAAALDTMSSVISRRKRQIALLDEAAKSLFVEMFGDPVENPMGWDVELLGDIADDFKYGTSSKSSYEKIGHPILRIPNIVSETISLNDLQYNPLSGAEYERYKLAENDILFIRTNGTVENIGKCVLVQKEHEDFVYASYLIRARVTDERINHSYLISALRSDMIRKDIESSASKSAGQNNINIKKLSNLKIPLPPLDLQNLFAARIEALEAQRASCERGLKQMETAFAAMMQEYFG